MEVEAPASALSDEKLLRQLLFIFLDNARKYSEEPIAVSTGASDGSAWIRVADRGVGIPKEELPKVFDRFYRVDQARSRQNGGFGLGLSLAKEIAEALGARLELDSLEGVGTTATIYLPQTKP
ncbi:sensor histidine kinase [Paenibacillaceae bacterium WGS1546]|uniref:sensor histidine kinase n=1 Tax=Cohnella sp. WGS1546 TaxID=3366810 RepID=UPI00372D4AAC